MIFIGTYCDVSDNSGAKKVKCIKIPAQSVYAKVGQIIVVSVKSRTSWSDKSNVYRALLISTKKPQSRKDGSRITGKNSVVLLKNELPIGTRILSYVSQECRKQRYARIISLAPIMI